MPRQPRTNLGTPRQQAKWQAVAFYRQLAAHGVQAPGFAAHANGYSYTHPNGCRVLLAPNGRATFTKPAPTPPAPANGVASNARNPNKGLLSAGAVARKMGQSLQRARYVRAMGIAAARLWAAHGIRVRGFGCHPHGGWRMAALGTVQRVPTPLGAGVPAPNPRAAARAAWQFATLYGLPVPGLVPLPCSGGNLAGYAYTHGNGVSVLLAPNGHTL